MDTFAYVSASRRHIANYSLTGRSLDTEEGRVFTVVVIKYRKEPLYIRI